MGLSEEEVARVIAAANKESSRRTAERFASMRLGRAQLEELKALDPGERLDRARSLIAAEGRPWHPEMAAQVDRLALEAAFRRELRPSGRSAKVAAYQAMAQVDRDARAADDFERRAREIAIPLDE